MPPRKKDAAETELCREHFPLGWDTPHIWDTHASVSCEHGQWDREIGDRTGREVERETGESGETGE